MIFASIRTIKFPISALAALTAATGYLLAAHEIDGSVGLLAFGFFLLASGSGALNHFQDRSVDARMERTRRRPLPSGRVRPLAVLAFGAGLSGAGLAMLVLLGPTVALAGSVAVFLYNGAYAFLKPRTAMAVVVGSLTGAIPPAAGWHAGGGAINDPAFAALLLFFVLWQMPHYFLLLLRFGSDYRKAGLPSLQSYFDEPQLSRLAMTWFSAFLFLVASLPLFGLLRSYGAWVVLVITGILTEIGMGRRIVDRDFASLGRSVRQLTLFVAFSCVVLSIDGVLSSVRFF